MWRGMEMGVQQIIFLSVTKRRVAETEDTTFDKADVS
jgi:hypothetical protein